MMEKLKKKKFHITATFGAVIDGVLLFQGAVPKEAREPKIEALLPSRGPSGTQITISGSGFSTQADIANSSIAGTKVKGEEVVSPGNYVFIRDQIVTGPIISVDSRSLSFAFNTASLKLQEDCFKADHDGCDLPIKVINAFGKRTNDKNFRLTQATVSTQPPPRTNKNILLLVTLPTGGFSFLRGMPMGINWQYAVLKGEMPQRFSLDADLLKNGVFYRKIASGVRFDIGKTYSPSIPWTIPRDIEPGSDYKIAIYETSSKKPSMYGEMDKSFVILGDTVTLKGKFLDGLTRTPLPWAKAFNAKDLFKNQLVYDNLTGNFSLTFSPNIDDPYGGYFGFEFPWQAPTCYMPYTSVSAGLMYHYYDYLGTTGPAPYTIELNSGPTFDALVQAMSYRIQKRIPILSDTVDVGEIDIYPVAQIRVLTDIATPKFGIEYADLPNPTNPGGITVPLFFPDSISTGGPYEELLHSHSVGGQFPVGYSTRVVLGDKDGNVYYSPWYTAPASTACGEQVLTFSKGAFKWQPYAITASQMSFSVSKVGDSVNVRTPLLNPTGGTAPYTWSTLYGSLPPGLTMSESGAVSGTVTASGRYPVGYMITDANGTSGVVSVVYLIQ